MKDIFKHEDFISPHSDGSFEPHEIAYQANNILKKWLLDKAVRVTGVYENNKVMVPFGQVNGADDTHSAFLIDIQKLDLKVCEHEAKILVKAGHQPEIFEPVCFHCGVKLKAVWAEIP